MLLTNKLSGADAKNLIANQIAAHKNGIEQFLSSLDPDIAFYSWLNTIRSVEEFINLPMFGLDDEILEKKIVELRLDEFEPDEFKLICKQLEEKFGNNFETRFRILVIQAVAIRTVFKMHGLDEAAAGLQSIKHAIGYFQSRRRHLVALLYTIPTACRGGNAIKKEDTLNLFLPQIEHSGLSISGLRTNLMLAAVFSDFTLTMEKHGFSTNHQYNPLNKLFLEPERAGIMEMLEDQTDINIQETLERTDPKLIFSAAELRNNILLIEVAYAEFELENTSFTILGNLIRAVLAHCEDDYFVKLSVDELKKLAANTGISNKNFKQLIHSGGDYEWNTNSIAPFIIQNDTAVSTVTFLSRFLYYWKNICLNRIRRYQIRTGFILEKNVKNALSKQGFKISGIKRINHKEFDVVTTLNDVIYNFQCKNNLVDIYRITTNVKLFVRYNRSLDRAYAMALKKEIGREELLKNKLGLSKIEHFVVSRFPIATSNTRVIPYKDISKLDEDILRKKCAP